MSEKPISPLRRRMLDDMTMRRFTPDTQRDYIRTVRKLAAFLGGSPDTATAEDLRAFQLHLTATGVRPPTINAIVTVLRFFFKVTLDHPDITRHLVFVYEPRKLPRVLTGGGAAPSGGGRKSQAQGGAQRGLWGRPAGHGGCRPEGERRRDANARYSSFDSSRTALAEFIFGCILLHLKALNNDFCGP
jgi:hypothetical protein